jgi:hypothetical protein
MVNPNRFYTYAYLRIDRTPYYIGKGKGNRISNRKKRDIKPPKDKSRIIFLKQNLTEEEAFKNEIYMIAVFGRKDLGTGILHNRTNGGEGASGVIHTPETRAKISASSKDKIMSAEARAKMSAANKGRTHSPETKAKMSASRKGENHPLYGKTGENNPRYGKTHSPETKAKIGASNKGKIPHTYGKPRSPETKAKLSAAMKGENHPNYGKPPSPETRAKLSAAMKGENNHLSKLWKITTIDGNEIIICGMTNWAKENGYSYSALYNVYKGKRKKHKDIIKVEVLS